jgi:hypothetical protein
LFPFINTTVALGDQINGEIQIHTEESWALKKQTDELYNKWRNDIEAVTNARTLPPEKVIAFDDDVARTKALWDAYWAAVPEDVKASISALDSGRDSTMAASDTPSAGPQTPSVSTSNRPSSRLHPQMRPSGSRDKLDRSISESVPQDPGSVKPDSGKLPGGRQAGGTILFDPDEWQRLVAEGRRLFSEGADQFGAWSEAMVAAAGEEIRPALQQLWELAVNPAVDVAQAIRTDPVRGLLPDGRRTQVQVRVPGPAKQETAEGAAAEQTARTPGKGTADGLSENLTPNEVETGGPAAGTAPAQPDPRAFVPAPDGGVDWGRIDADLANRLNIIPGAIRLREGTPGMGRRHIEQEHGDHIAGAGYETSEDLVATVLRGYSEVRMIMEAEPAKEHEIGRLILVKRDKKRGLAAIEMTPSWSGDYYEVVSAYPIRANQKIRGELLGSAGESAASVLGPSGTPTYRPGSNPGSQAAGGVRTGTEQLASESIQSIPDKGSQDKPDPDLTTQATQINEFVVREGQGRLDAIGSEIAAAAGGRWQGTPKSVKSLVEKVTRKRRMGRSDYDIYSPKDHARGTITVARWDDVPTVLELLREQGFAIEVTIDQPLNQFGYRGINTTVALGDQINGEIQIHTEESWALKKQTDELYNKWRDVLVDVDSIDTIPADQARQMRDDIAECWSLWENYWATVPEALKSAISSLDRGLDSSSAAPDTPVAGPQTPSWSTSNRDSSSLNPQMRPSGSRDKIDRSISESVPQDPGSVKPDSGKLPGGRQAGGTQTFRRRGGPVWRVVRDDGDGGRRGDPAGGILGYYWGQ